MGGEAYDVIKQFWSNQDSGDYTRTAHMFSEDAVFDDPKGIVAGVAGVHQQQPLLARHRRHPLPGLHVLAREVRRDEVALQRTLLVFLSCNR